MPAESRNSGQESSSTENARDAARDARLRYVSDAGPGIQRKRAGTGFSYRDADGNRVSDAGTLARIRSLAIPPAWTDVWISPHPNGHLQATGRDARGRKQYRYHPRWRTVRDEAKYDRLIDFGEALPVIRKRTDAHLAERGMTREKVLATVVRLLEDTLIRVGNEEYARQNQSYGLTTLRNRHVEVNGSSMRFRFRGKGGKQHTITVSDARLARVVKRSRALPGQALFEYLDDDDQPQPVDSGAVNDYLQAISGSEFTAKDFRTWAGTLLAMRELLACSPYDDESECRHNIAGAIERVAERLGNTPAICRKCYVHPLVIERYSAGSLADDLNGAHRRRGSNGKHALSEEEAALLAFLKAHSGAAG